MGIPQDLVVRFKRMVGLVCEQSRHLDSRSPSLTTGLAGAPRCMFSGMSTRSGGVMDVQAKSRMSLH